MSCNESPSVVKPIVENAKLLKDHTEKSSVCSLDEDAVHHYKHSYITMDRTIPQQEERRKLVIELKDKIASEPSMKWIINKFGKLLKLTRGRITFPL